MTFQFKLIGFCALSFVVAACTDKLDRQEAKELIIKEYNLPFVLAEKLQYGEINYSRNFGGGDITTETILSQQGLISFNYIGEKRGDLFFRGDKGLSYASYNLQVTAEGESYLVGEGSDKEGRHFYSVKVADLIFFEVTGIREIEDGKLAEVEYTWKYANLTPFGRAYNLINTKLNQSERTFTQRTIYNESLLFPDKVIIAKYDDGWRIKDGSGPPTDKRILNPQVPRIIDKRQRSIESCDSKQKLGDEALFILGEGVRVRSDPDASSLSNILFKLGKKDIPKVVDKATNEKGELWYKICYEQKMGWITRQYSAIFVINSLPIDSNQHPEGPSIFNSNASGFRDLNEFYSEFKKVVTERNMEKLSDFVQFPFDAQFSQMSKEDFIKNFSFSDDEIENIMNTSTPTKYDSESYGINSDSYGLTFKKDKFGNWRWISIFYGE